jgi:uncharacterized protein (DUF885 family)
MNRDSASRTALSVACFVALLAGSTASASLPARLPAVVDPSDEVRPRSASLKTLLDDYAEFLMRENPLWATTRGDFRFNDKLGDVGPVGTTRRAAATRVFLDRVKGLDRSGFMPEDHLDADLLVYELGLAVEGEKLHTEQMPINSQEGPHIWLPQMSDSIPFQTPKDFADYASRVEQVSTSIDQTIDQMKLGLAAGRVPPAVVLAQTVASVRFLGSDDMKDDPTKSPFYRAFQKPGADAASAERARKAISEALVPAYRKLADFLEKEYIPKCRQTLGISEGVDGADAYRLALKYHTTTDLTAEQIHEIGLKEVARIKAQMLDCMMETDWAKQGKVTREAASLKNFINFLRTDSRFYYTDAKKLLGDYRDICKKVDAELPRFFGNLPRNTYGVREIPKFAAATAAAAYCNPGSIRSGVPGYFMVNTHQLDQRPSFGMVSLALHEAVPGHHLQLAIADELERVHPYRTMTGYTAFVEGWALYTESLGLEMSSELARINPSHGEADPSRGIYADPYDYFGRLSDEMWRACRLVVDTGLHAMKWPRQQALDYMLQNTAGTELDLSSEVDRYIGWPGQACAYKIGELKIKELRARATAELGTNFDIRGFHDQVLGGGALPLPVLEKQVDRWVQERQKAMITK